MKAQIQISYIQNMANKNGIGTTILYNLMREGDVQSQSYIFTQQKLL